MRTLWFLLLVSCAPTPVVKLRVPAAGAARLDAVRREQGRASIETARHDYTQAEADLKKADAERAAPPAAETKQRTPELEAILRAGNDRRTALIAWRKAQLEVARWHLAITEAQFEMVTAEAVTQLGVDVDPARFRAQVADLQGGRVNASRDVTRTRAALDQREKTLSAAKERYAATVKAPPTTPPAAP